MTLHKIERLLSNTPELDRNSSLTAVLQAFHEIIKPDLSVVYYPGSGLDNSPSKAFPKTRVIYVDTDDQAVRALRYEGYEAYCDDADEYTPVVIDLVLLSGFHSDKPLDAIVPGGYVISSDWWRTADKIAKNKNFELVGVLKKQEDSEVYTLDLENPQRYLESVESDEELRSRASQQGVLKEIKAAVERSGVSGKSLLDRYKKVLEKGEKIDSGIKLVDETGQILHNLPRKIRSEDGFFVFRRRS